MELPEEVLLLNSNAPPRRASRHTGRIRGSAHNEMLGITRRWTRTISRLGVGKLITRTAEAGRRRCIARAGGGGRGERATQEFFSEYLTAPVRNRVSNYCNALTLSREKGWDCHFFFGVGPDEEGASSSVR